MATDELKRSVILAVREQEALWNPSTIDYRDSKERTLAWQHVATNVGQTVDDCRMIWRRLSDDHKKCHRRVMTATGKPSSEVQPRWKFSQLMDFMKPFLLINAKKSSVRATARPRRSTSSANNRIDYDGVQAAIGTSVEVEDKGETLGWDFEQNDYDEEEEITIPSSITAKVEMGDAPEDVNVSSGSAEEPAHKRPRLLLECEGTSPGGRFAMGSPTRHNETNVNTSIQPQSSGARRDDDRNTSGPLCTPTTAYKCDREYEEYGRYVGVCLQGLQPRLREITRYKIDTVIHEAKMQTLNDY